jgi:hypothetical protein
MRRAAPFGVVVPLSGCGGFFVDPERFDARIRADHPTGSFVASLERRLAREGFSSTGRGDGLDPESLPSCMVSRLKSALTFAVMRLNVCYRSGSDGQIEEPRTFVRGSGL